MIRTQIQLREAQAVYVKRVAAAENISMAEVIRQAIELLQQTRSKSSKRELMQRALTVFDRYDAGENDISSNHDAYLDEAYGA